MRDIMRREINLSDLRKMDFNKRILTEETPNRVGEEVVLAGWVDSIRDHGGLTFIDLRDWSGKIQIVVDPDKEDAFRVAKTLRNEYVAGIVGTVRERAKDLVNDKVELGHLEIVATEVSLINKSKPIPFPIDGDGREIDENVRLKYRYIDLRRDRLKRIIRQRQDFILAIRKHLISKKFTEVITPLLTVTSPEGARDFIVPSRIHKGKVFVLPQAPQQYKQLLMAGGVDKYFQIAPCARDEDPRADRHAGVFYQIDLEMSFPTIDKLFGTCETLLEDVYKVVAPSKKFKEYPFPRIPYREALDRFGTDKPDLRYGLELLDITEIVKDHTEFGVFNQAESVKAIVVPHQYEWTRKEIDSMEELAKKEGAKGLAYIKYENSKPTGGISKFISPVEDKLTDAFRKHIEKVEETETDLQAGVVFFVADKPEKANKVLGKVRIRLAEVLELQDPNLMAFAWIQEFPFYEINEDTGRLDFGHNPFSMPVGGVEAFDAEDPLTIISDQYDLAFNGYEVLSGSIRNHDPEVLVRAFERVGYDRDVVKQKFGALYTAFQYGVPPHGGWAIGLDRLFMELINEPNIRDVYAFPKSSNGMDIMMGAPSVPDEEDLKVLGITLPKVKPKN